MVWTGATIKVLPLLAASAMASVNYPPIAQAKTTPVQQRLAVYGPNSISVGWNTYDLSSTSCMTSSPTTYQTSRTWFNKVILDRLTPATTYFYKIVSTNSTTDHFLSPRSPGDTTSFAMDVVIDLGVYGKDGYTQKRDTPPQYSDHGH